MKRALLYQLRRDWALFQEKKSRKAANQYPVGTSFSFRSMRIFCFFKSMQRVLHLGNRNILELSSHSAIRSTPPFGPLVILVYLLWEKMEKVPPYENGHSQPACHKGLALPSSC